MQCFLNALPAKVVSLNPASVPAAGMIFLIGVQNALGNTPGPTPAPKLVPDT